MHEIGYAILLLNKPYAQKPSSGIAADRRTPAGGRSTASPSHSIECPQHPKRERGEARPGEQVKRSSGGRVASGAAALQLSPHHQLRCDTRIVC